MSFAKLEILRSSVAAPTCIEFSLISSIFENFGPSLITTPFIPSSLISVLEPAPNTVIFSLFSSDSTISIASTVLIFVVYTILLLVFFKSLGVFYSLTILTDIKFNDRLNPSRKLSNKLVEPSWFCGFQRVVSSIKNTKG